MNDLLTNNQTFQEFLYILLLAFKKCKKVDTNFPTKRIVSGVLMGLANDSREASDMISQTEKNINFRKYKRELRKKGVCYICGGKIDYTRSLWNCTTCLDKRRDKEKISQRGG